MPPSYFPLRWESTGDQWWYASPIDWAAANGHYDLVRELLHLDTNLLIKLTSLRRIRRLETVWDDEAQFDDVARCRSQVARKLFHECENKKGRKNSLIRAGYGGWLLYTAASAGDVGFVQELLERDPLLVYGEGEFGVTDIFYAAARSKSSEVFRVLFDFSVSPRCFMSSYGELGEQKTGEVPSEFKWEMMNRGVHAAARGGNLKVLKEILGDCSDVLSFRDLQGSTILHAASGRGQVEVVEDLIRSFSIMDSIDNQGNTALHIAAYRGHIPVVEALILASPLSISLTNNSGNTFLHMVVAGFQTPGFQRVDRQFELMKKLMFGKIINIEDIINVKNNEGRTALHTAIIGNVHGNLVELLITVPSIDLNIKDLDGMTPLDLLKQRPRSASSEILVKQLISAGCISNSHDYMARTAIVSHMKIQGIGSSPGTSFRIPDAEIFLYTGTEISDTGPGFDQIGARLSSCSSELSESVSETSNSVDSKKKRSSISNAASRLRILLRWPRKTGKKSEGIRKSIDEDSMGSFVKSTDSEEIPTPLRQRFSKSSTLPTNKRVLSVRSSFPSPSIKKKVSSGLTKSVVRAIPHPSGSLSGQSVSSSTSLDKQKGVFIEDDEESVCSSPCNGGTEDTTRKSTSLNKKLYYCFGAQGLAVNRPTHGHRQSVPSNA